MLGGAWIQGSAAIFQSNWIGSSFLRIIGEHNEKHHLSSDQKFHYTVL